MLQIAVFVDAGYLYAQSATALVGKPLPRTRLALKVPTVLAHLKSLARKAAPEARLLRVYWYDALNRNGKLSEDQDCASRSPDVKIRLGALNGAGQQKGVDSLIVTDIIELARNRAITDALVLTGDGDIQVGFQIAQSFGARLHLVGIGEGFCSQSPQLTREADTVFAIDRAAVETFMATTPEKQEHAAKTGREGAAENEQTPQAPTTAPDRLAPESAAPGKRRAKDAKPPKAAAASANQPSPARRRAHIASPAPVPPAETAPERARSAAQDLPAFLTAGMTDIEGKPTVRAPRRRRRAGPRAAA